MKLRVDPKQCISYGECVDFAPELFELDDVGTAFALNDGEVPPELEEKARQSVKVCPAGAISIEE
ncbi:MAG: ferredoxin [Actinobacteria bacterium]|nr:ferredoxin [Actinomycetota bacterium]